MWQFRVHILARSSLLGFSPRLHVVVALVREIRVLNFAAFVKVGINSVLWLWTL